MTDPTTIPSSHTPQPTEQPRNPRWPTWKIIGAIIAVSVMVSVVNGVITGGDGYGNIAETTFPSSASSTAATRQEDTKPAAPAAPTGPAISISAEGTYEIGTDLQAGTYKTTGPSQPGSFWTGCYYARLADFDGELGSINANENFQGPNTVTVKPGDAALRVSGDCVWRKVR